MRNQTGLLPLIIVIVLASTALAPIMHFLRPNAPITGKSAQVNPLSGAGYAIHLTEKGLPQGKEWYSYIGPANQSYEYDKTPLTTTGNTITFYEGPGHYSFSVGAVGPYVAMPLNIYGNVSDGPIQVNVTFMKLYNVTVTEFGLPNGTEWASYLMQPAGGVGDNVTAPTDNIKLSGTNGSYTLHVYEVLKSGKMVQTYLRNVTISGSPLNVSLRFYKVTLKETGLSNGSVWGFGSSLSGPGNSSTFTLWFPNGSFSIRPGSRGYYDPGANFTVNGEPVNVIIPFEKEYYVRAYLEGLPNLQDNFVHLFGVIGTSRNIISQNPSSATRDFYLPNGTYTFNYTYLKLWSLNGGVYEVNVTILNKSNHFRVSGSDVAVNLSFNFSIIKEVRPPVSMKTKILRYTVVGIIVLGGLLYTYIYLDTRRKR